MINVIVIVIFCCVLNSSNYVLEIFGCVWYYKVLNIFVIIGKFVIFFLKKERNIYIFNKWLLDVFGFIVC